MVHFMFESAQVLTASTSAVESVVQVLCLYLIPVSNSYMCLLNVNEYIYVHV